MPLARVPAMSRDSQGYLSFNYNLEFLPISVLSLNGLGIFPVWNFSLAKANPAEVIVQLSC